MKKICCSLVLAAGMTCLGEVSAELAPKTFNVEIDTSFVEAGRAALEAVGYFDANRVDAAVLQERLIARPDARLLETVRVVTLAGEQAATKHVVEYIFPTDYEVRLNHDAASTTNAAAHVPAIVEPQSFMMREVGAFVNVTPTLMDEDGLIDLSLMAELVGEPEWKNYGAQAIWDGAATGDLPMDQPFFPLRASVDTQVLVRPGRTLVFGGMTDSRRANEDKFVLAFVTTRLVDFAGNGSVPPQRRVGCASKQLELDFRYVSADGKTLGEVGYFGTNRVDAAVLLERLGTHRGAKLLESPRLVTRPGEEAVVKGVLEYIYPTDYVVVQAESSQMAGTNAVNGIDCACAAVKPQSFTVREVGTIVDVTPIVLDDGNLIDLRLVAQLVGEPEWKDYGEKAKWKGSAIDGLTMEQPLFPVRSSVDTSIRVKPGETCVFSGGADTRTGDEGQFVLVFVTPRFIEP